VDEKLAARSHRTTWQGRNCKRGFHPAQAHGSRGV
jgi:hypothetical protein